ncbi:hypothetical protein GQ457_18G025530 [Hibiscus cannabinus]
MLALHRCVETMLFGKNDHATEAANFTSQVIVLNHTDQTSNKNTQVTDCHTSHIAVKFAKLLTKINKRSGKEREKESKFVKNGDTLIVKMNPTKPMVVETFSAYPPFSRFVVEKQFYMAFCETNFDMLQVNNRYVSNLEDKVLLKGTLKLGMVVIIGLTTRIKSIEMHHESLSTALSDDDVVFNVKNVDVRDLKCGFINSNSKNDPATGAANFTFQVIVLNHTNQTRNKNAQVTDCHTSHIAVKFAKLLTKINKRSGKEREKESNFVKNGDTLIVKMNPTKPMVVETFSVYPPFSRFVVEKHFYMTFCDTNFDMLQVNNQYVSNLEDKVLLKGGSNVMNLQSNDTYKINTGDDVQVLSFNFPCVVLGGNACITPMCGNHVVWKGTLKLGKVVIIGLTTRIKSIEMHHESLSTALSDDDVGFNVKNVDVRDLKCGFINSNSKNDPTTEAANFTSQVIVLNHTDQTRNKNAQVTDCHTSPIAVTKLLTKINKRSGKEREKESIFVKNGDTLIVKMNPTKPMVVETFSAYPPFILFVVEKHFYMAFYETNFDMLQVNNRYVSNLEDKVLLKGGSNVMNLQSNDTYKINTVDDVQVLSFNFPCIVLGGNACITPMCGNHVVWKCTLKLGMVVIIGLTTRIKSIEMHHESLSTALSDDDVGFNVKNVDVRDLKCGFINSNFKNDPATEAANFTSQVIVLNHTDQTKNKNTQVTDCHTSHIAVTKLLTKINKRSGKEREKESNFVKNGDTLIVKMNPTKPMVVETFSAYPPFSRLSLRSIFTWHFMRPILICFKSIIDMSRTLRTKFC